MGHYAIYKMSLRARETVYWPGINEDIRYTYHHCHICAKFARTQQKETLQYICNDRELSCFERVKLVQNLQNMHSVALPNLPLSSPVLIQKINMNITKTPYLTILMVLLI